MVLVGIFLVEFPETSCTKCVLKNIFSGLFHDPEFEGAAQRNFLQQFLQNCWVFYGLAKPFKALGFT